MFQITIYIYAIIIVNQRLRGHLYNFLPIMAQKLFLKVQMIHSLTCFLSTCIVCLLSEHFFFASFIYNVRQNLRSTLAVEPREDPEF